MDQETPSGSARQLPQEPEAEAKSGVKRSYHPPLLTHLGRLRVQTTSGASTTINKYDHITYAS